MNPIHTKNKTKKTIDIVIEAQEKRREKKEKKMSDRSIQIAADKPANG